MLSEVMALNDRVCPSCSTLLKIKRTQTYNYDPIVMVEEVLYRCPVCGYEENTECMKQMNERT